jgi:hypothetical protein
LTLARQGAGMRPSVVQNGGGGTIGDHSPTTAKKKINTNPTRPNKKQGGVALQGEIFCGVAAARLQGSAETHRSLPRVCDRVLRHFSTRYESYGGIGA